VLATVGSLGDLHPFLALGRALQRAGIGVVLASAEEYRDRALAADLPFQPLRPSHAQLERDLACTRAELTRAVLARPDFLFRTLVLPYLRASYEDMAALCAGADLVLTSSLAFGARLAAEQRGVPWLGVVLQPYMFLSAHDPPVLDRAQWVSRLMRAAGPRAARVLLRMLKAAFAPLFGPLHALRRELGLPRSRVHPLFEGQFGTQGAIALYSPLLGGPQPDHPVPTAIVGFAAQDGTDDPLAAPDARLEAFLGAGPPPLVFTLGSLVVGSPGSFYHDSLEAARRLGRRAVLLVGEDALRAPGGHGLAVDPGEALVCGYVPHSRLFARAALVVHHGGIGTLAQALRSGRPQLIVPFFADQLDNAARAQRLGLARVVAPRRYRARRVQRELAILLGDARYAVRAAAVGRRVAAEDGAATAAALISARLA
jgi:UDP:flavonoid glycosyltransferase YjiC (YdhE family)